jgi:hypothetical protein
VPYYPGSKNIRNSIACTPASSSIWFCWLIKPLFYPPNYWLY